MQIGRSAPTAEKKCYRPASYVWLRIGCDVADLDRHLVLCERCLNAFDIKDGGVELETPYRLTVADRVGKMQEVWQVGKCYVCPECLGPQGAKCQNVS